MQAADLSVSGVNTTAYAFSGFSYNPGTFTATWTLAAPIADDYLELDLAAKGMAPVTDAATGEVLDGAGPIAKARTRRATARAARTSASPSTSCPATCSPPAP